MSKPRPGTGGASKASSSGGGRAADGRRGASPSGVGGRPGARSGGSKGRSTAAGRSAAGSGRPSGRGPQEREVGRTAGPKQWGSLGRKGAGRLTAEDFDARNSVGSAGPDRRPAPEGGQARWELVEEVRGEATAAVRRGGSKPEAAPKRRGRPAREASAGTGGADAKQELVRALGASRGARANERLRDAAHAFERERYEEARKLLKPLAEQAPQALAVRELLGLTYYRLGRWKDAARELEAFRAGSGSTEQHPVLADTYRALGRHREVEALWDELREASPSADLVAEGRIVMAGSLADRDELAGAIRLLQAAPKTPSRPAVHHLRQTYVLADLYERAGDVARARELFRAIASHEPEFVDAAERAASLG